MRIIVCKHVTCIHLCSFLVQELVAGLDQHLQPAADAADKYLGIQPRSGSSNSAFTTSLPSSWSDATSKSFLAAIEQALGSGSHAAGAASPDQVSAAFDVLYQAWQLVAAQRALQGLAQDAFQVPSLSSALQALQLLMFQEVVLESAAGLTAKLRACKR